ncbi:periplasmic sensor hybrid histidine kinase [Roseibium sp. TrichSKD4]|nr:periplasmic sensor hybrid histidine kinase [Roseibium sp. TrichSKD4]
MTWIGLQRVDTRMQELHRQSLTRVAQAIDLSKRSSDLATTAPYLLNQRSNFLIDREGQKLVGVLDRVRKEWPDTSLSNNDENLSIGPITTQMENGIKDLVDASKRLDVVQSSVRQAIAKLGNLREQVVGEVENSESRPETRLAWWTLQAMTADALNAAYADNLIGVGEEQRQYQRQRRQLASPALSEQQRAFLEQLEEIITGETGIFELRRQELAVNLQAQNALFRIRRDANLVNELAVGYASRAEAFLAQERSDSSSTIQFIKLTLAVVSLVSLALALSAALFVSRYVAYNIGRVSDAMVRLANGDRTSVLPRRSGNDDEIGDLFRSFRSFRANALRLDRSHKQLNQRNALFEKVFANIAYGIAITDATGKVTASNPAFADILEIDPDKPFRKPLADWFHEGKFARSAAGANVESSLRGQLDLIADDGQVLELRASQLPDDGRVWLVADVTESHTMSARLAQIDRIEALGKVAGDTAHDFANILSTIRTHAHLLTNGASETQRANVSAIENAVEFGGSLTERLLAFARKQNLVPEIVELNSLLEGMIELAEIGLREGVALNVMYSPEPLHVIADPGQMESTLLNLILNANNAIEANGEIAIQLLSRDDEATIIIKDDGIGMPANVRTKAIEPFFSTRAAEGGTGLGLSIVYGFIKQSGGNLEIESEEGEGTVISISMPLANAVKQETENQPIKTALVIDDDQQVRHIVDSILCDMNYQSTLCSNANDALKHLETGKFQLVVSDFDLGSEITGHDILETSAEKLPDAMRILISGKSSLSDDYDGPNAMVQKPVTAQKLKFALQHINTGALH